MADGSFRGARSPSRLPMARPPRPRSAPAAGGAPGGPATATRTARAQHSRDADARGSAERSTARPGSTPSRARCPAQTMPPYQRPDAAAIGRIARRGPSPTSPANGATKERTPGTSRPRKMPRTPKRRYSRSIVATAWGEKSHTPEPPAEQPPAVAPRHPVDQRPRRSRCRPRPGRRPARGVVTPR